MNCNRKDPWISDAIKTSLRKKSKLYKKYIKYGSKPMDLNALNIHSSNCSELIRSSKKLYFNKLSDKLNDPHIGPKIS